MPDELKLMTMTLLSHIILKFTLHRTRHAHVIRE